MILFKDDLLNAIYVINLRMLFKSLKEVTNANPRWVLITPLVCNQIVAFINANLKREPYSSSEVAKLIANIFAAKFNDDVKIQFTIRNACLNEDAYKHVDWLVNVHMYSLYKDKSIVSDLILEPAGFAENLPKELKFNNYDDVNFELLDLQGLNEKSNPLYIADEKAFIIYVLFSNINNKILENKTKDIMTHYESVESEIEKSHSLWLAFKNNTNYCSAIMNNATVNAISIALTSLFENHQLSQLIFLKSFEEIKELEVLILDKVEIISQYFAMGLKDNRVFILDKIYELIKELSLINNGMLQKMPKFIELIGKKDAEFNEVKKCLSQLDSIIIKIIISNIMDAINRIRFLRGQQAMLVFDDGYFVHENTNFFVQKIYKCFETILSIAHELCSKKVEIIENVYAEVCHEFNLCKENLMLCNGLKNEHFSPIYMNLEQLVENYQKSQLNVLEAVKNIDSLIMKDVLSLTDKYLKIESIEGFVMISQSVELIDELIIDINVIDQRLQSLEPLVNEYFILGGEVMKDIKLLNALSKESFVKQLGSILEETKIFNNPDFSYVFLIKAGPIDNESNQDFLHRICNRIYAEFDEELAVEFKDYSFDGIQEYAKNLLEKRRSILLKLIPRLIAMHNLQILDRCVHECHKYQEFKINEEKYNELLEDIYLSKYNEELALSCAAEKTGLKILFNEEVLSYKLNEILSCVKEDFAKFKEEFKQVFEFYQLVTANHQQLSARAKNTLNKITIYSACSTEDYFKGAEEDFNLFVAEFEKKLKSIVQNIDPEIESYASILNSLEAIIASCENLSKKSLDWNLNGLEDFNNRADCVAQFAESLKFAEENCQQFFVKLNECSSELDLVAKMYKEANFGKLNLFARQDFVKIIQKRNLLQNQYVLQDVNFNKELYSQIVVKFNVLKSNLDFNIAVKNNSKISSGFHDLDASFQNYQTSHQDLLKDFATVDDCFVIIDDKLLWLIEYAKIWFIDNHELIDDNYEKMIKEIAYKINVIEQKNHEFDVLVKLCFNSGANIMKSMASLNKLAKDLFVGEIVNVLKQTKVFNDECFIFTVQAGHEDEESNEDFLNRIVKEIYSHFNEELLIDNQEVSIDGLKQYAQKLLANRAEALVKLLPMLESMGSLQNLEQCVFGGNKYQSFKIDESMREELIQDTFDSKYEARNALASAAQKLNIKASLIEEDLKIKFDAVLAHVEKTFNVFKDEFERTYNKYQATLTRHAKLKDKFSNALSSVSLYKELPLMAKLALGDEDFNKFIEELENKLKYMGQDIEPHIASYTEMLTQLVQNIEQCERLSQQILSSDYNNSIICAEYCDPVAELVTIFDPMHPKFKQISAGVEQGIAGLNAVDNLIEDPKYAKLNLFAAQNHVEIMRVVATLDLFVPYIKELVKLCNECPNERWVAKFATYVLTDLQPQISAKCKLLYALRLSDINQEDSLLINGFLTVDILAMEINKTEDLEVLHNHLKIGFFMADKYGESSENYELKLINSHRTINLHDFSEYAQNRSEVCGLFFTNGPVINFNKRAEWYNKLAPIVQRLNYYLLCGDNYSPKFKQQMIDLEGTVRAMQNNSHHSSTFLAKILDPLQQSIVDIQDATRAANQRKPRL